MQELQLYVCICRSYTSNIIGPIFFRTRCSVKFGSSAGASNATELFTPPYPSPGALLPGSPLGALSQDLYIGSHSCADHDWGSSPPNVISWPRPCVVVECDRSAVKPATHRPILTANTVDRQCWPCLAGFNDTWLR